MNNQTIEELNNRKLDRCYFSIICIPIKIYFKEGENNINLKDIYIFYGCTLQGVRKFITAVIANDYEKTSEWYNLFLILKRRNVDNILYALLPDNKLLKDAIKLAFPEVETFVSCFEAINKINKYYPQGYCSKVFKLIKNIYLSETSSDYNIALDEFKLHYGSSNFIMDLLEKDFKYAKSNYCYNLELRKHIFSFYFFRDVSKKLIVISHSKPYFNDANEFVNDMIHIIKSNETKMYCPKNTWINLLNMIYEIKKDLIKPYL